MMQKIKELVTSGRDLKAAKDRMNETLEIREPVVAPIRKKREERLRASQVQLTEPIETGEPC